MLVCPHCAHVEEDNMAIACIACGESLEPTLRASSPLEEEIAWEENSSMSETKEAVKIGNGRFVVEKFLYADGAVQYYEALNSVNQNHRYLLAVCPCDYEDPLKNIAVALEQVLPALSAEQQERLSENPFRTEFHLLNSLQNSGIPRVFDCFTDEKLAYLILEKFEGQSLRESVAFSLAAIRSIGIQLCDIANYLHQQGFTHNGFVPENLILLPNKQVKLIKFDSVRPCKLNPVQVPLRLQTGFSAPELYDLVSVSNFDPRMDIYSIGALLYWLLTQQFPPQNEAGVLEFYPRHIIPPALERILRRALASSAWARYETVSQMQADLQKLSFSLLAQAGYSSDVGRYRDNNEDSALVWTLESCFESHNAHTGLYIVSDGMGGEAAGEIASRLSVRTVAALVSQQFLLGTIEFEKTAAKGGKVVPVLTTANGKQPLTQVLADAVTAANQAVIKYARNNPQSSGLGATLTVGLLTGNILTLAQVGDSRCYLWRNEELIQLTEDHSIVEQMIRRKELDRHSARFHPQRNVIYRAIGSDENLTVDTHTQIVQSGDLLLFCSDGLTTMLDDLEIANILQGSNDPWHLAQTLTVAANMCGGEDNVSVIVVVIA
jgi:serine/threonine protein phosphatase PrpC